MIEYYVLLNQRDKNKAIGIEHDTQFLRGLSGYAASKAKGNVTDLVKASFLKANIDEYKALAEKLTDYIMDNIDDADVRSEGIYIMKGIEAYTNELRKELDKLWQP